MKILLKIISVVVMFIAAFSLTGIVLGVEKFTRWGSDAGMATNTAICLLLIGFAILIISDRK